MAEIRFPNGSQTRAATPQAGTPAADILQELRLQQPKALITIVGGAGGLSDADMERLRPLFEHALVPAAETLGATVLDGGTDAGVMRMMGQARGAASAGFPLIGVAVESTIVLPGGKPHRPDAAPLEPNHTHFVLVPGEDWGDESAWLDRIAGEAAKTAPTVTVLINGGEIARQDVKLCLAAGRPVIVVAGSGRAADQLAAAKDQPATVHAVDIGDGAEKLRETMMLILKETGDG
jgi:hypothetical protein